MSYENGQLKGFLNNWQLYDIKETPTISSQEATEIAIQASKSYAYNITADNGTVQTITGFKISPKSLNNEVLGYLNFDNPGFGTKVWRLFLCCLTLG